MDGKNIRKRKQKNLQQKERINHRGKGDHRGDKPRSFFSVLGALCGGLALLGFSLDANECCIPTHCYKRCELL